MLHARGEAFQAVSIYIWPEEEGLSSPFQQCGKEATIPLIFRHVETEGKLNSQQLTQFPVYESEMETSKANTASHALAAGTLTGCSEAQICASWQHFYRHSNIKEGQMAEEMGL